MTHGIFRKFAVAMKQVGFTFHDIEMTFNVSFSPIQLINILYLWIFTHTEVPKSERRDTVFNSLWFNFTSN